MKSVGRFYYFHFFYQTPTLQILVYKLSAQVPKLTTLSIDFSIKLPTRWYITTLVPSGVQRNDFSGISSNGLVRPMKSNKGANYRDCCTPLGTKVPIHHFKAESMLNTIHNVVKPKSCAISS